MIEIQHGCIRDLNEQNVYFYSDVELKGYVSDYQSLLNVYSEDNVIRFTIQDGEQPEIGDFIDDGRLVKRTKPKVNSDWSRWKDKDL